ncbi:MAG: hypothetical protein II979_04760, partial [Clostridia bacterium]|nr:hypothetical protein [Clostridia bacterium]
MKRVFICLLAALLLFSATACGGNEAETEPLLQDTAAVEETEPAETSRADTKDGLPEGLDFNGETVHFIIIPECAQYDALGESGGDVVFDAV